MKTIFAALASAVLLAAPMASISTPVAAQAHGGGFHGGGGARGGGFHGGGGFRGGGLGGGGVHGGFPGGHHHHGSNDGVGFLFGLPFDDPYYYDDPDGYYDDGSYDDSSSACGSWTWDAGRGAYDWIPC